MYIISLYPIVAAPLKLVLSTSETEENRFSVVAFIVRIPTMIPVIVARMIGIAAIFQLNITAVLLPEPSESIRPSVRR